MKGTNAYNAALYVYKKISEHTSLLSVCKKRNLYKKYLSLLRESAYSGHLEAQYDLGQQYENISFLGMPNPKYNPKKCIYWYTKASKGGHAEAYNNLAHLYETGQGCQRNLQRALKLYKNSAELGSLHGKKNYKIMLKDMSKGGKYYGLK